MNETGILLIQLFAILLEPEGLLSFALFPIRPLNLYRKSYQHKWAQEISLASIRRPVRSLMPFKIKNLIFTFIFFIYYLIYIILMSCYEHKNYPTDFQVFLNVFYWRAIGQRRTNRSLHDWKETHMKLRGSANIYIGICRIICVESKAN